MAKIIKFDRFPPRLLSKDEMTIHFLEQSIRTLSYKLRKACDENNQTAIEKFFDMLAKARQLLRKMQAEHVIS
jgi:hypothetical protein